LKHPLALGTGPRLLRRDGQSGSTELETLPTTCRHANWRTALRREGAQRLILRPAIVLYVRDPTSSDTGKAAACPRAAQIKRRRTELSASHNGSPGAVGRHNNTANRVAFGCGCPKHPRIRWVSARARRAFPLIERRKSWKFVQSCSDPRARVSCKALLPALS
jgi:hypothetical protein